MEDERAKFLSSLIDRLLNIISSKAILTAVVRLLYDNIRIFINNIALSKNQALPSTWTTKPKIVKIQLHPINGRHERELREQKKRGKTTDTDTYQRMTNAQAKSVDKQIQLRRSRQMKYPFAK